MLYARPRSLGLLAAAAAFGCATMNAGSPNGPPIQTDRSSYVVRDSGGLANVTIHLTYHNHTGKTTYLPTCRGPQPPRLQKQVGDTWVIAFAPTILACEGPPIEVADGSSYDYTFQILAGMPGTSYAPRWAVGEIPGTYRILWEIFSDVQRRPNQTVTTTTPLPVDQEISNTFQLTR